MTDSVLPPREPGEGSEAPPTEGGVGFAAIRDETQASAPPPGASDQPPASGPPPPTSYQPPSIPPPVSPTPPVSLGAPEPPPLQPPQPAKKSRNGLIVTFVAVAAAAIGAIVVKFVLPLALVGIAGQVLDSAFGGPYGRLPGDVRSGFDQRLTTALGDRFEDQTDSEQAATVLRLVE